MPTNLTIRYSKMSPVESTVTGDDLFLVGQPDATNVTTGYGVYKERISVLSTYYKNKLKVTGLKDYITVGAGVIDDGSPGSLGLDEPWWDKLGVRHDKLSISYVGERTLNALPIDTLEKPSTSFKIRFTTDIPVLIGGVVGTIKAATVDITTYVANPANSKIYMYAIPSGTNVAFEVRNVPVDETLARTLFAIIQCGATNVTSITAVPFSRLGLYRLSATPRGSSVANTIGSFGKYVDKFWQTRWYGSQDVDWDDYFIQETVVEGPVYQMLSLAPAGRLEFVVCTAGGGGGGSQNSGGVADPLQNGQPAEESVVTVSNAEIATYISAQGGVVGEWNADLSFINGGAGSGAIINADVSQLPAGVVSETYRFANGSSGFSDNATKNNAGGSAGVVSPALPAYVPDLSPYGIGGKGAAGIGDDGQGFGGGGGGGAVCYGIIRNDTAGLINIVLQIGNAGLGGVTDGNQGSAGTEGVIWYRQIPK